MSKFTTRILVAVPLIAMQLSGCSAIGATDPALKRVMLTDSIQMSEAFIESANQVSRGVLVSVGPLIAPRVTVSDQSRNILSESCLTNTRIVKVSGLENLDSVADDAVGRLIADGWEVSRDEASTVAINGDARLTVSVSPDTLTVIGAGACVSGE